MEDRIEITECLYKSISFKPIARRIGKDPSTVFKEVKLHVRTYNNGLTGIKEICPFCSKHRSFASAVRSRAAAVAFSREGSISKDGTAGVRERVEGITRGDTAQQRRVLPKREDHLECGKGRTAYLPCYCQQRSSGFKVLGLPAYPQGLLHDLCKRSPRTVKFKQRAKSATEYVPKGIRVG